MKDKVIPLAYLFNGGYLQDNGHTTAPMPTAALAENRKLPAALAETQ